MRVIKEFCPFCMKEVEVIAKKMEFGYAGMCRTCKNPISGTKQIEDENENQKEDEII